MFLDVVIHVAQCLRIHTCSRFKDVLFHLETVFMCLLPHSPSVKIINDNCRRQGYIRKWSSWSLVYSVKRFGKLSPAFLTLLHERHVARSLRSPLAVYRLVLLASYMPERRVSRTQISAGLRSSQFVDLTHLCYGFKLVSRPKAIVQLVPAMPCYLHETCGSLLLYFIKRTMVARTWQPQDISLHLHQGVKIQDITKKESVL